MIALPVAKNIPIAIIKVPVLASVSILILIGILFSAAFLTVSQSNSQAGIALKEKSGAGKVDQACRPESALGASNLN